MNKIEFSTDVYGWTNEEDTDKRYVGFSPPSKGDEYISSTSNPDFWRDYQLGLLKRVILFKSTNNNQTESDKAQTLEWFAQKYSADILGRDNVYHKVNGHCVDESLLSVADKQVIIDWVDSNGTGVEINVDTGIDEVAATIKVIDIRKKLELSEYERVMTSVADITRFRTAQNRVKESEETHVNILASVMNEKPETFDAEFDPIIVVIQNGVKRIHSGVHRSLALPKVKGREYAPVIYINESEFGDTPEEIKRNLEVFGAAENPERSIAMQSNSEDIQFWIGKVVVEQNLDPASFKDQEDLREIMRMRYVETGAIARKSSCTKSVTKWLENWHVDKEVIALGDKNLKSYSGKYLSRLTGFEEQEGRATIINTCSKLALSAVYTYVSRRMFHLKNNKGLIVLYYSNMKEYVKYNDGLLLEELKELIKFKNEDIEVKVLPAFEK